MKLSFCSLIIILLFSPLQSFAQDSTNTHQVWASMGLGLAGDKPFAGVANLSYQTGANLFSLQGAVVVEFCVEYCNYQNNFLSLGILYGRSTLQKWAKVFLAFGPALVTRPGAGTQENDPFNPKVEGYSTIGLAVDTQCFLHGSGLGFGVDVFANLNYRDSFLGITLNLHMGTLR